MIYKIFTIQESFSSVSDKEAVDFTRVGEESLIESTQALILAPAPAVSCFLVNFFLVIVKYPPEAGNGLGTTGENRDLGKATVIVISIAGLASDTITFWFVIPSCLICNKLCIHTLTSKSTKTQVRNKSI